jgi:hypothetical protein
VGVRDDRTGWIECDVRVELTPRPSAVLAGLFLRAFTLSLLQSAGIVLLAAHSPYALCTAFAISYLWLGATRAGVDHRIYGSRIAYGLGGASGCLVTLVVSHIGTT